STRNRGRGGVGKREGPRVPSDSHARGPDVGWSCAVWRQLTPARACSVKPNRRNSSRCALPAIIPLASYGESNVGPRAAPLRSCPPGMHFITGGAGGSSEGNLSPSPPPRAGEGEGPRPLPGAGRRDEEAR